MRRFTILGLMALILGAAVAVAALRNADDYWAGGMMLATALLIGVATLGAVYHSGRRRAGRLGFAVFAGGYFAVVFLGLSAPNLAKLPTTWLLVYIHDRVAPPAMAAPPTPVLGLPLVYGVPTVTSNVNLPTSTNTVTTVSTSVPTPAPWQLLLPGAANYEAFGVVGHCLFALLAGLLGIVIARRYQARHDSVRFER